MSECVPIFTMGDYVEQRICLKFCVANEFSCADALKMLQKAFGDNALSKTRAYQWYRAFKDGREVVAHRRLRSKITSIKLRKGCWKTVVPA